MRILSIILLIIGILGIVNNVNTILNGDYSRSLHGIVIFSLIGILGILSYYYYKYEYRGGLSTILGAILIAFGISMFAQQIDMYLFGEIEHQAGGYTGGALFIIIGLLSVKSGHKLHKSRFET